ncbi:MAG TPA: hypothetical protein VNB06_08120 [Thermoanaerobaculia bacterium]|nr:hypothetical protein [Thermoanaerobaculia bacterium]
MCEAAARHRLPVVDVESAFAHHAVEYPGDEMFGRYDLVHATATGAEVIARATVAKLREFGRVPLSPAVGGQQPRLRA